ncbi:MAG: OmpA family protein [Polyangiaceae bacterium]|nr:OmpA family protein [Polyangiaceae bacterium]MCE7889601.1 OmpA family protein [Sorangiineae bacterium PRO1]MCL4755359.1 OmpA family protein [Myxococcales bacterium]
MAKRTLLALMVAATGSWSSAALAQAAAEGSASTGEGVSLETTSEAGDDNYIELGLFAGALFPSEDHNFEDSKTESGARPHLKLKSVAPDFGLRAGYYPVRFVGLEIEGAFMPTKDEKDGKANLSAFRGHLVGQMPLGGVTPFVLLGFGSLGANSDSMGKDRDPALHFGAGVKIPVSQSLGIRLDLRDNMTQKDGGPTSAAGDGDQTHHPEVLLGLSLKLGLSKKEAPAVAPKDSDGDGFFDPQDKCPTVAGVAPDGCPPPDSDKDGFIDPEDKCPTEPGIAPDGCPDKDPDKDGILDPEDKCPNEAGVAPDGCPDKDPDKDGILDPNDKCPKEPETKNNYLDEDGCPDEVPAEVKKFTGVIEGIEFDTGKATIRPKSTATLDAAVKVLTDFPTVKLEISGHTDNVGKDDKNLKLSQDRADAVKKYFTDKGIDASRIQTRGAGPNEPIADNKTAAGKQKNRRTEFKLIQ